MSDRRLYVITAAMMLSILLASLEGTIVSTAMPTIVAELGGLSIYAWVFSIYMLTSTTTIPVFGKLSDIYGRRPVFVVAMVIYLVGSAICGTAQSMQQLVLFRAVQGIGAGGLLPLAFTVIGDIFTLERRAKMQGVFSSIWGVSSILGPLVGGFLVDTVSWRWVFLVNLPVGVLAIILMLAAWRDVSPRAPGRVDYAGAALLSGGIIALMLAFFELNGADGWRRPAFWLLLALSAGLLFVLLRVERRAANPMLPLSLFRERVFAVGMAHGFLAGFAVWGSWVFIPLFSQTVLGTSATQAGFSLTPMDISWVIASVIGSRLLLKIGYRQVALIGMAATVAGMAGMALVGPDTPYWLLLIYTGLMGIGMGCSIPAFTIAVQSTVARQSLGAATSSLQFSRNIGGTIGTSLMGVFMAGRIMAGLTAGGLSPDAISLGQLLDPLAGADMAAMLALLRDALSAGVRDVFLAAGIGAAGAWAVSALAPRGRLGGQTPPTRPSGQPAGGSVAAGE